MSDGLRAASVAGMGDESPGPGWWVGSDGAWHSPEEDFGADVPKRSHPMRRVVIVLLAVAVVGATTVGAWLGQGSPGGSGSVGPSLAALNSQVDQVVTGTGADQFGVTGVSGVVCQPPDSWIPGATFECSVYANSDRKIGVYDGTVVSSTSAGEWRWRGTWYPTLHPSAVE